MDIENLCCFAELARSLHMTETSRRLFISQQTLSKRIQRLEEDCGVSLFVRKPKLSLTSAGEHLLKFAENIAREHVNLRDVLADISSESSGVIRLGGRYLRINPCLAAIMPAFTERYPKVELRITNDKSQKIERMTEDGIIDLAVVMTDVIERQSADIIEEHLMDDTVCVCAADSLLNRFFGAETESVKERLRDGATAADFAGIPFCVFSNRMGKIVEDSFTDMNVPLNVLTRSDETTIGALMCFKGLAACCLPQTRLIEFQDRLPEGLNVFPFLINGQKFIQHLALIRRKDRYLTAFTKYFIELLTGYFRSLER